MQKFIAKYGAAAHLALTAVAPLVLSPIEALWLAALAAIWTILAPSCVGGEHLHEARSRVFNSTMRDPLTWVLLCLVMVSLVRFLNTGVALGYDAEQGAWSVAEPMSPLFPGSVEGTGLPLVGASVAAFVVLTGLRHALGRSARLCFLVTASSLAGIAGVVMLYLFDEGTSSIVAAAECTLAEPVYLGNGFGVLFVGSVLSLAATFERRWLRAMPFAYLGVTGTAIGLFLFSPTAVAVLWTIPALVLFLFAFVCLRLQVGNAAEFKYMVVLGLALALAAMLVFMLVPNSLIESRIEPFETGVFLPAGFASTREALSELSLSVWKQHPWLGTGLGSFALDLQFVAKPQDWEIISALQSAPLNGYWQLLVERGVIGAFCLAVPLALLLVTYVMRLVGGLRAGVPHPLVAAGPLLVAVAAVVLLGECGALMPGFLVPAASILSISASAFRKETHSHG